MTTHELSGTFEIIRGRWILEADIVQTHRKLPEVSRGDIIHIMFFGKRTYAGQVISKWHILGEQTVKIRFRCWRVWYVVDIWNWIKRKLKR